MYIKYSPHELQLLVQLFIFCYYYYFFFLGISSLPSNTMVNAGRVQTPEVHTPGMARRRIASRE